MGWVHLAAWNGHSPSKSEQPAFADGLPKQPASRLGEGANALDCAGNGASHRQAGSGRPGQSARAVTIDCKVR